MTGWYKASEGNMLESIGKEFEARAVLKLMQNRFIHSPFSTSWFGKNNLGGYTYEFCKLLSSGHLQWLTVHIPRGDRSVSVFLNIFALSPAPESLEELSGLNGLKFAIRPLKDTSMNFREEDRGLQLLFHVNSYRVGRYFTKRQFEQKIAILGDKLERDFSNIQYFVNRWYKTRGNPQITDWEGRVLM